MNPTVIVTFVDAATGEAFATSQVPVEQLPESFLVDTTLHLGENDWSVEQAVPARRAEFIASGTLTLQLRRIMTASPQDILYSLPTISDWIPSVGDEPLTGNELRIAEDDWRQMELVSNQFVPLVDEELSYIRAIHEQFRVAGSGWREIHLRTSLPEPLANPLPLVELARMSGSTTGNYGLAYHGTNARIAQSYAFLLSEGLWVYGLHADDQARVLAIAPRPDLENATPALVRLQALAHQHQLMLVSWCPCLCLAPTDPNFLVAFGNA